MMVRGVALFFFTVLISQNLSARTYPNPNFHKDPGANSNHVFGVYKPANGYKEPDFNQALQLASPLKEQKFESYDIVVLVNILNSKDSATQLPVKGQKVRVYARDNVLNTIGSDQFQQTKYDSESGLLFYWNVSTAKPGKNTPRGYYRPESFSSAHQSSLYNSAPMPWAMFFYGHIATHGILGDNIPKLGTAASAGCVRMEPQRAKDLFQLVGLRGKDWVDKIDRAGNFTYTTSGEIVQEINYKTLISVQ